MMGGNIAMANGSDMTQLFGFEGRVSLGPEKTQKK